MLNKKIDVLTKARKSDGKLSQQKENSMRDQITGLKQRLDFMEEEHRVRIQFICNVV
jgi:hypothetical protein